ncbi:MAG: undecaprenyl-phosphate glucose phosphotransferase [Candidatus Wenzhouxiangella sp. M2_3B_020]
MPTTDRLQRMARVAVLADAAAVFAAAWIAWWWRFGRWPMADHYVVALVLGVLLALVLLPALGAYRGRRWPSPGIGVLRALPGLAMTFVALVVLAAATKTTTDFSRLWTGGWFLSGLALMAAWRFAAMRWRARRGPRDRERVLVVGAGELAAETARRLIDETGETDLVTGFLAVGDESSAGLPGPVLGGLDDLERVLETAEPRITEIWLATGDIDRPLRERMIGELQVFSLPVRYVPDLTLLNLIGQRPRRIAGLSVIELNATPLDGPDAIVKAALDRVAAALLLLLLSPLLLVVALLIRLDSRGPVLFRQPRHGSDGRVFDVLKFRTMKTAEAPSSRQATRGDPRVTRIGRILRRTSIDELPQLVNVLTGDMSLVGPRPHPVALNHAYAGKIHAFMQRHRVKPGITGWAQIHGFRGETDTLDKMRKRFEHDLYYIENWSLGLDFRILALTALRGWRGENAY